MSDNVGDAGSLESRIEAEFKASAEKLKKLQAENVETHRGRQDRLQTFAKKCEELGAVWKPKLEALAKKFAETASLTPKITPSIREATFDFRSELASIKLKFSAWTDEDVRNLVLDYDLHIIPILMKFEPHARMEFPLEATDPEAVEKWLDDRIVDFVKTYLSLHENEYYLKSQMETDPIAGIQFPRSAAGAKLERDGKTWYFIGEETKREFEKTGGAAESPEKLELKAEPRSASGRPEKAGARR
jgi:YHS domain-containing protein